MPIYSGEHLVCSGGAAGEKAPQLPITIFGSASGGSVTSGSVTAGGLASFNEFSWSYPELTNGNNMLVGVSYRDGSASNDIIWQMYDIETQTLVGTPQRWAGAGYYSTILNFSGGNNVYKTVGSGASCYINKHDSLAASTPSARYGLQSPYFVLGARNHPIINEHTNELWLMTTYGSTIADAGGVLQRRDLNTGAVIEQGEYTYANNMEWFSPGMYCGWQQHGDFIYCGSGGASTTVTTFGRIAARNIVGGSYSLKTINVGGQTYGTSAIIVDPENPNIIYLAGNAYVSTNNFKPAVMKVDISDWDNPVVIKAVRQESNTNSTASAGRQGGRLILTPNGKLVHVFNYNPVGGSREVRFAEFDKDINVLRAVHVTNAAAEECGVTGGNAFIELTSEQASGTNPLQTIMILYNDEEAFNFTVTPAGGKSMAFSEISVTTTDITGTTAVSNYGSQPFISSSRTFDTPADVYGRVGNSSVNIVKLR